MVRLADKAKAEAGDLVRRADALARELENEIDILLYSIRDDLKRTVEQEAEKLRKAYAQKKEDTIRTINYNAEIHMDEAVNAILEEIKKILSEV
ncbi:MAG: hypothetical protein F7C34_04380 [Desulfurococcales archaeon]|nr:hypothetical protein [Desulfurococcales archaeon]